MILDGIRQIVPAVDAFGDGRCAFVYCQRVARVESAQGIGGIPGSEGRLSGTTSTARPQQWRCRLVRTERAVVLAALTVVALPSLDVGLLS
ncbi:hypothetical protein [Micromonospora ureilytica]|uniref:hypothetical protein n=1 Tax=Micromonospora ureilytica TaxID=709868 RepID=UPI00403A66FB